MPELPEMEITARRLAAELPGQTIESVLTPGINVLKTFDPPLSALDGATFTDVRRRGKLLLLEADTASHGPLTLLVHLMSAGPADALRQARLAARPDLAGADPAARRPRAAPARVRDQAGGVGEAADARRARGGAVAEDARPGGLAVPPELGELLSSNRPLHSLLRDQQVIAGIGRTWVDEILHAAKLSPFKRGDDLSEREATALREAMVSELGRVLDVYEDKVKLPLPEKFPKPTRVHAHQGEPCPRCETVLEAVFYEDYVMSYCPHCQTEGRILKDRRLSRLLK